MAFTTEDQCCGMPEREHDRHIHSAIDGLCKTQERLSKAADSLMARLLAVMGPDDGLTAIAEDCKRQQHSPVADRIEGITERIGEVVYVLHRIESRLEV